MDKAPVYGTGDCRFESYQGHFSSFCDFGKDKDSVLGEYTRALVA